MIDSLAMHLTPFLAWLLRTTCQASILIGLILLIQKAAGRWLGVRGCYGLWLLVLIRLAMPWPVQSRVSVYNLLPLQRYEMPTTIAKTNSTSMKMRGISAPQAPAPNDSTAKGAAKTPQTPREPWPDGYWPQAAVFLWSTWLTGVCSLAGCTLVSGLGLRRVVRRGRPVTDRWILDLLEDGKRLLGIRAGVRVIAADGLESPALLGLVRPRLLLPREALAERNRTELRHIFLHELAHLKRHDVLMGYVASLLHLLHWFNPLLAWGFRRMRADRELACDGLALSVLAPDETAAYGRTIVHQIEQLLTSRPRWVLTELGGDRAQIKRRIAVISAAGPHRTYHRSPLAIALVGVLAWTGLTNGITAADKPVAYAPAKAVPTTHQDKHAFIERLYIRNRETGKYLVADGDRVACDANEPGDAGLWEARFNDNFGHGDPVFFYSVSNLKYLRSDGQGNLAADRPDPDDDARWIVWARPQGVWVISEKFKDGYLRLDEQGFVSAVNFGRDSRGYWDIDGLWRIKTSDHPKDAAEWHRQHVPGPDWQGAWPNWRPPK